MKKLIIVLILISGCSEYRAKQDIAECIDIGYKPDTEAFMNCRLQMKSIRAQRAAAYGAIINRK